MTCLQVCVICDGVTGEVELAQCTGSCPVVFPSTARRALGRVVPKKPPACEQNDPKPCSITVKGSQLHDDNLIVDC